MKKTVVIDDKDMLFYGKRPDFVIGIDPDVEKNGFADVDREKKRLIAWEAMSLPPLMARLKRINNVCKIAGTTLLVVVEAGWKNQGNWHLPASVTKQKAAAMGVSVGRNQQVGRAIVELCRYEGINVVEAKPLRKCWHGKDGKITTSELEEIVGCKLGRCSQDVRDAVLLAWTKAELPLIIKPKTK